MISTAAWLEIVWETRCLESDAETVLGDSGTALARRCPGSAFPVRQAITAPPCAHRCCRLAELIALRPLIGTVSGENKIAFGWSVTTDGSWLTDWGS